MRLTVVLAIAAAIVVLPACTGTESGPARAQPVGSPAAATESPAAGMPANEVRAASDAMETWALLYRPSPWRTGERVKVVWRSTGEGEARIVAVGPGAEEVAPVTGPTPHFGSSWNRPGDEWGTFFQLDEPGEWTLQLERGTATASVPVTVTS